MLVVQGITTEGKRFRPRAWADMLVGRYVCPNLRYSTTTNEETKTCVRISKHISICCNAQGVCEVHVDGILKDDEVGIYEHVKAFAITNELKYTEEVILNEM